MQQISRQGFFQTTLKSRKAFLPNSSILTLDKSKKKKSNQIRYCILSSIVYYLNIPFHLFMDSTIRFIWIQNLKGAFTLQFGNSGLMQMVLVIVFSFCAFFPTLSFWRRPMFFHNFLKPKLIRFHKKSRDQTVKWKRCFYKKMKEKHCKVDISNVGVALSS